MSFGNDLDGVWRVERTGGLLPPLLGVRKRIAGDRGWTALGPLRWPFGVVGLELRYDPPFGVLVDELRPDGPAAYDGRAKLGGRVVGSFRMTRV